MKLRRDIKKIAIDVICFLFILLFVYAAVSKLLDFENFEVQVGQSPLVSVFASWIVWLVPVLELIIALLLSIPKLRLWGLLAAFSLMTFFTVYIFIVLNYSSFIPCSCGGILEKMSWKIHLVFNIVFMMLAMAGVFFKVENDRIKFGNTRIRPAKSLFILFFCSAGIMILLYLQSEKAMHYENPFIRRYPNHPATLLTQKNLKVNSFYIAGISNGRIYLGNYTKPLYIISVDEKLKNERVHRVAFDPKNIPFKSVTISVIGTYFYLKDGTVPSIFRGETNDWKINREFKGMPYFTQAEPMDSTTVVFRSNNGENLSHIIGVYNASKQSKVIYNNSLLQKQIDGVFDTDGILTYSEQASKVVYLYLYRNQFIVADQRAKLIMRGNTIDTTTQAKIKVSYLKNSLERRMSAPPYLVNAKAAVCENLLFVQSKIKGKYENDKLWNQASIIDVYDIIKNRYLMSFPVYNLTEDKMTSFKVSRTHLYAVIGRELVVYDFKDHLKNEIKSGNLK